MPLFFRESYTKGNHIRPDEAREFCTGVILCPS